jgi:hypothetical protein
MKNKVDASEFQIQCALIEWAKHKKIPGTNEHVSDFLIAIPNGGSRHIAEALNLKRSGVKAGVSDLFFAYPRGGCHGMWIELKKPKGAKSKKQAEFITQMQAVGYLAGFVYGLDDAILIIEKYLGM